MMKFFKRNKIEVKENPAGQSLMLSLPLITRKFDSKAFAKEGYQQNIIVYRAVNEITRAMSGIDIDIFDGDIEVEGHPALTLLERPNPTQSWSQFVKNVFTDYLLTGEMFIHANMVNGEPTELWALSPMNMDVKPGRGGVPSKYVFGDGATKIEFPVDAITGQSEVFFMKMYNPLDYWRGLPPMAAAALSADAHNAGLQWNYSLLRNGCVPSGVLELDGSPSEETVSRLRELFKKTLQGQNNAGDIPMLVNGVKFQPTGINSRDMDFMSTMKETAKYVASSLGVPLPLIDNDASTFNNLEKAQERLYTDTVIPMLDEFLENFGHWILPSFGEDLEFVIDKDSIDALESVRAERETRVKDMVASGILTINEAREAMGYAPLGPAADTPFISATMVPLDAVGLPADVPAEEVALAKTLRAAGFDNKYISEVLKK